MPEQLRTAVPTLYKTAADLRKALKDLGKTNKRLKDVDPDIADRRETFEKVRTLYQSPTKNGTWIAVRAYRWGDAQLPDLQPFFDFLSLTSKPGSATIRKSPSLVSVSNSGRTA